MAHTELDLRERRAIEDMLNAKMPVSKIAAEIGRHRSTVHREIKRNRYFDGELPELNGYYGMTAQRAAVNRRARRRKLVRFADLRRHEIEQLVGGWSPEQIAGRMRLERHPVRVSHETIYRYAYSKAGRDEKFYRHLPQHRLRRRPRGTRRHHGRHILDELAIAHRPPPRPANARRLITFDRGTEFSARQHLKDGLGVEPWFCDPQSPWQKGTVENTNNRLRRYLPRKADPTAFTNRYLRSNCDRLNTTPRKCLGYQTPAEVFRAKLMEGEP